MFQEDYLVKASERLQNNNQSFGWLEISKHVVKLSNFSISCKNPTSQRGDALLRSCSILNARNTREFRNGDVVERDREGTLFTIFEVVAQETSACSSGWS